MRATDGNGVRADEKPNLSANESAVEIACQSAGRGDAFRWDDRKVVGATVVIALIMLWSYAEPMGRLIARWWREPDYVYGFLVVPFAAVLLWLRRDMLRGTIGGGRWWAVLFFAACAALRCLSAYISDPLFDPLSLIPCLAGLAVLFGGVTALKWAWPSLVFLLFMIPLPSFTASLLSSLLQRIVTVASTFALQAAGIAAVADGNIIVLPDGELGVVDACGGLRSVMLFLAVAVAAALLTDGIAERIIIVVSAAPVTIAANVVRVTVTGVLYETINREIAEAVFHDLAGLFMLPLAVGMLWGEVVLLRKVLTSDVLDRPFSLGMPAVCPAADPGT